MKTADIQEAKCGACGPAAGRLEMIRQAAMYLVQGHEGVAQVYDSLAEESKTAGKRDEQIAYMEAAATQRRLAKESSMITLPDDEADRVEAMVPQ